MFRELVVVVLVLLLVSGYVYRIPVQVAQEYDPPSVFNYGGGGYSVFYNLLTSTGYRVGVVYSPGDLEGLDPRDTVLVIASPDHPLDQGSSRRILEWVSRGGVVIALDEIGSLKSLLEELGARYGFMTSEISTAYCRVGNTRYTLYLNKYTDIIIENPDDTTYTGLCTSGNYYVGLVKRVGGGLVVFIGDSSLFINKMIFLRNTSNNLVFFRDIVDGRRVFFYEGGRAYVVIRTETFIEAVQLLVIAVSGSVGLLVQRDPLLGLLLVLMASLLYILVYLREDLTAPQPVARPLYKIDRKYVLRRCSEWRRSLER